MSVRIFAVAVGLLVHCFAASAQEGSYYVVIGAFEIEANAQKLANDAQLSNVAATYSFNESQKLYYVFVRNTYNEEHAYATLDDMHAEGFRDAWVFHGSLSGFPAAANSHQEQPIEDTPVDDAPVGDVSGDVTVPIVQEVAAVEEDPLPSGEDVSRTTVAGKPFVFKIINDATGATVAGMVRLQEAERSDKFRPYTANETVYLVPPGNRKGKWYVTCRVIGFRWHSATISYENPREDPDVQIGAGGEIILPIRLTRVKRGDYIEMDQVGFFRNSSILTPDSRSSLTELLAMMQENSDYRIRLHGHTNGNEDRDIVALGQSDELFALNSLNERRGASAKDLSELRAGTVKRFLEANGIAGDRIDVKGEGGKQPVFDPRGTNAGGNDRIEVEVTRQ